VPEVDLHLHTNCSDGSFSPEQLASLVNNARIVALTDHDTTEGLNRFRAALKGPLLIEGVELSVKWSGGNFHMLAYGMDLNGSGIEKILAEQKSLREKRNREMLELAQSQGIPMTEDMVAQAAGCSSFADKSVGRPHFALVLVELGLAKSVREAFELYLTKGKPLYAAKSGVDPADMVERLSNLGLAPVIAHPFSLGIPLNQLEELVRELSALGLAGIECHYCAYSKADREALDQLAKRCGLIATGGSDFHGIFKPDLKPLTGYGDLDVPLASGERLLEEVGRRATTVR
jgi:predicted metal-dependent phosphoesterase TrpH